MTSRQTDPVREDGLPELPLDELIASAEAAQDALHAPIASRKGRFEHALKETAWPADPPEPAEAAAGEAPEAAEEEDEAPPKRHPLLRAFGCIALVLITLVFLFVIAVDRYFAYHNKRGKEQLVVNPDNVSIHPPTDEEKTVTVAEDGKTVTYKGSKYRLNENLATILFMGIDRTNLTDVELYGSGGQADSVLLIVLDTKTGVTKIINISREAYADIELFSGEGQSLGFSRRQLCLAYAYGDGREQSCENMVRAVSRLLYDMPVMKYIALDMEGVVTANDAIGGVTLTSLNDMKMPDGRYVHAGDEITLRGENCERYIRKRETQELDSNGDRMARHVQYVRAFSSTLMQQAGSDFRVITNLYDKVTPYLVSDLDTSDVVFLAQWFVEHRPDFQVLNIDGTYDLLEVSGKENAVYYLDETSLFETVLDVFYLPVE